MAALCAIADLKSPDTRTEGWFKVATLAVQFLIKATIGSVSSKLDNAGAQAIRALQSPCEVLPRTPQVHCDVLHPCYGVVSNFGTRAFEQRPQPMHVFSIATRC